MKRLKGDALKEDRINYLSSMHKSTKYTCLNPKEFKNMKGKTLNMKCSECNTVQKKSFYSLKYDVTRGREICWYCSRINTRKMRLKSTINRQSKNLRKKGMAIVKSEYVKEMGKFDVTIKCKKGHLETTKHDRLSSFTICEQCNPDSNLSVQKDIEKILISLKKSHSFEWLNPTEYKGYYQNNLKFRCLHCENIQLNNYESILIKQNAENKYFCTKCSFTYAGERAFLKNLPRRIKMLEKRGLKFLSYEKDERYKYIFELECSEGHVFYKDNHQLHTTLSCQTCTNSGLTEEIFRQALEFVFGIKFICIRPKWLIKDKLPLELDCYSHKAIEFENGNFRHIAFEINGVQHKRYSAHFHKGDIKRFKKQKARDLFKVDTCKKKDILLFSVDIDDSRFYGSKNVDHVLEVILSYLKEAKIKIPAHNRSEFLFKPQKRRLINRNESSEL